MKKDPATRILLIEDNETNRSLMVYLLKAFGYASLEASDGKSGIEAARRHRPELIVCDVHLPKLDGYGVVRELKSDEELQEIPVVAVTALAMVGDRDRILAAGFNGYVGKPIAPETFVQDIEKFLSPSLHSHVKPAAAKPAKTQSESPREVRVGVHGTVLVVDDTPENLDFVRSTLEPLGYTVLTASSVEKAVAVTRKQKPDLLLCDLHMQPHSGLDLLERVKVEKTLQDIPIVIISSTATGTYDAAQCFERGAAGFVRRPIEPEELLAEIRKMLNSRGRVGK